MLLTPAEHEIAGFATLAGIRKQEVKGRHRNPHFVRSVESLTAPVNERLTQNAIERDAAMTELMVRFAGATSPDRDRSGEHD